MENLREHCLFEMEDDKSASKEFEEKMHKSGRTIYFEYMKRVHSECKSRIDESCSSLVLKSQGVDFDKV